jgi:hypothetical protein
MNDKENLIVIGQFSLVLGILGYFVNYFYLDNNLVLMFIVGVLFGLAFVLNLGYLLKLKK